MPKQPLSLAMSQIIAHDAPLLSPTDSNWEPLFSPSHDNFTYAYYNIPPSPTAQHPHHSDPLPAASMLKTRVPAQDLCLPTHQLFDFPEALTPPSPPTRDASLSADAEPILVSATPTDDPSFQRNKRSASPAPSATKKRAVGERISSKDFVPPDVSGLSKREARLVKNRAAAFLSRQRKREEFECMEVRVAELEQENARLLALTQSGSPSSQPSDDTANHLVSEVEQLKAQLAAARERELSLSAQLANSTPAGLPNVKVEASDHNPLHTLPAASPRSSISNSVPSPHKSGASFGLMVLLCALPSLLSMRMQSTAPTSFSIPNPFPSSSSYDYNSFLPSEYDWAKATSTDSSMMDLDAEHHSLEYPSHQHHNKRKQLEFTTASDDDVGALGSLGDLDISFDTSPTDDGKIRVRIHPSSSSSSSASSSSSRSGSPGLSTSSSSSQHDMSAPVTPSSPSSSSSLAMWSGSASAAESSLQSAFASQFSALSAYSSSHSSLSSSSSASSSSSSPPHSSVSSSPSDPFLGVPFSQDGSLPSSMKYSGMMDMDEHSGIETHYDYSYGFGMGDDGFGVLPPSSVYAASNAATGKGEKKRVRIALKSLPAAGGEGGEWEVQIC